MPAETAVLRRVQEAEVAGRRVLVRVDLNVPLRDGQVKDTARIDRVVPSIAGLAEQGARVILCSHLGRPKGKPVAAFSLAPVAGVLAERLRRPVAFVPDCVGPEARAAADRLAPGAVLLLENTRFHPGEEANDPAFAADLAALADIYVDDAFSAAHRAHASTEGVAHLLPAYAGLAMQAELDALGSATRDPRRPLAAVVGGAKISDKLALLRNLAGMVDVLVVGGAMANTFLAADGIAVGRSLQEPDMYEVVRAVRQAAQESGRCEIVLPVDAVVADALASGVATRVVDIHEVPADAMILDVGPRTVERLVDRVRAIRTLVWNGPLGAFETVPFDQGTTAFARAVASATVAGTLRSVAGGGDTVAALRHAGVIDQVSYVSTAGGAFLEWLEGRTLPGVAAVMRPAAENA